MSAADPVWTIRVCEHGHRVEHRENYGGWLHMDADARLCRADSEPEVVEVHSSSSSGRCMPLTGYDRRMADDEKQTAVGLVKVARTPSTPADLGPLAEQFGGVCDVVMLAVPTGFGARILDDILGAAPAVGINVRDERRP